MDYWNSFLHRAFCGEGASCAPRAGLQGRFSTPRWGPVGYRKSLPRGKGKRRFLERGKPLPLETADSRGLCADQGFSAGPTMNWGNLTLSAGLQEISIPVLAMAAGKRLRSPKSRKIVPGTAPSIPRKNTHVVTPAILRSSHFVHSTAQTRKSAMRVTGRATKI